MAEQIVQHKLRSSAGKIDDILDLEIEDSLLTEDTPSQRVFKSVKVNEKGKKLTGKSENAPSKGKTSSSYTSATNKKATCTTNTQKSDDNVNIMSILNHILENQKRQDENIGKLSNKMATFEDNEYQYEYDEGELEGNDNVHNDLDKDENDNITNMEQTQVVEPSKKRKNEEDSRFFSMAKKFKSKEICGDKVDEVLAKNITDVFRNGMGDEQYTELTKDENNARPENCEGLVVVRTNQLVWDIISPEARTNDRKMQNIETSVIKGSVILTKAVNKMADIETKVEDLLKPEVSKLLDECNDALTLFGHANRQINITRRDFIKPELRFEYLHICAQSVPYTSFLFGDDISKTAKEIEDCSKIGNKIHNSRGNAFRGRSRGRFRMRNRGNFRGRGNYNQNPYQGYGQFNSKGNSTYSAPYSKNYRRGSSALGLRNKSQ